MKLVITFALLDAFLGVASAQETEQARTTRLAELNNNRVRFFAETAGRTISAAALTPAISFSCPKPIFFASGVGGEQIKWLCDINRDGVADIIGTFWAGGDGRVSTLASFGGYLYGYYDRGSQILRFTDQDNNGVADREPDEVLNGAAFTERILPVGQDQLYTSQVNSSGRLFRYVVGPLMANVFNTNLPVLARYISSPTVSLALRTMFAVDQDTNEVKAFPIDGNGNVLTKQSRVVYTGNRIVNIAVDENSASLFVMMAGECTQAPQPPSTNPQESVATSCAAGRLVMVKLNQGPFNHGPSEIILANNTWMFNLEYNTQAHPMIAVDGKVYVVLFGNGQNQYGGRPRIVVTYDYTGNKPAENQPGTVFAGTNMIGDGVISALTTFNGGPISQVP